MPRCHISLGGNSGNVAQAFDVALDALRRNADCTIAAVSRSLETMPVGDRAGTRFLNAAAELETSLDPFALLDLLQSIENDLGRDRTIRWGPRTIDLDLLYYGEEILNSPRLVVPHPAAWYRRFVLDPLVEIAPDLVHPVKQATMQALRDRLLIRPLPVALAGGTADTKIEMIGTLTRMFTDVCIFNWERLPDGSIEPALIVWLGQTDAPQTGPSAAFELLPPLPRLDASATSEPPADFVRHVVQSALGM